jgi:hypothetical protein
VTEIEEILVEFQAEGITQTQIERTLDLGQGSLDVGNLINEPETTALLRIVRAFPWLLEVAEKRFDENESKRILLHQAVDVMVNKKINKEK